MFRLLSRFAMLFFCAALFMQPLSLLAQQDGENDETERLLRRNWSLFLEYFKNGDMKSARNSGWEVMRLGPDRFKTLHAKMVELYDTLATHEPIAELKLTYADTIQNLLDSAVATFPDKASEFHKMKGYYYERYFVGREADAIRSYEAGIGGVYTNAEDMFYLERLAVLYSQDSSAKMKSVAVCQAILLIDANNSLAQGLLRSLISDPQEFIGILRDAYYADTESRPKLYELANGFFEMVQMYDSAIVYFNKLIAIDPTVKNYWERIGASYLYQGDYSGASRAYKKMTELDPQSKEAWLNLARAVLQEGQYSDARTYADKASELEPAWGAPRMVVAQAYEGAVQRCVERTRGGWDKMKVIDKMVYLLAQTEYARAARDPEVADQARSRSASLSTLTPTAEDLFLNKIPRGTSYAINKDCYGWIGRSVTP